MNARAESSWAKAVVVRGHAREREKEAGEMARERGQRRVRGLARVQKLSSQGKWCLLGWGQLVFCYSFSMNNIRKDR